MNDSFLMARESKCLSWFIFERWLAPPFEDQSCYGWLVVLHVLVYVKIFISKVNEEFYSLYAQIPAIVSWLAKMKSSRDCVKLLTVCKNITLLFLF